MIMAENNQKQRVSELVKILENNFSLKPFTAARCNLPRKPRSSSIQHQSNSCLIRPVNEYEENSSSKILVLKPTYTYTAKSVNKIEDECSLRRKPLLPPKPAYLSPGNSTTYSHMSNDISFVSAPSNDSVCMTVPICSKAVSSPTNVHADNPETCESRNTKRRHSWNGSSFIRTSLKKRLNRFSFKRQAKCRSADYDVKISRIQSIISTESRSSSICSTNWSEIDDGRSNVDSLYSDEWYKHPKSKLYRAAYEILSSEEQYVRALEALAIIFPAFIESASEKIRRPAVQMEICNFLSTSLSPLLTLHQDIANRMRKSLSTWDEEKPNIAKVLIDTGPFIKMSQQFICQKSTFCVTITEVCRRNVDFSNATKDFEAKYFNGLRITHQMDCVHQRICRYPLLLSSYMKYLAIDSDEYDKADRAKRLMETIARHIEDGLAKDDEMRVLLEIQRRIFIGNGLTSRYELIVPGRRFLKEGEILKHSRKEVQSRVLLLFTDVLLYCAYSLGSNNLTIRYDFDLATLKIHIPSSNCDPHDNCFHIIGKKRSLIILTRSRGELSEWVTAINEARNRLTCSRENVERDGQTSRIKPSTSAGLDLGKVAPVWIPDDRVTMCQNCKVNFTKFRRRHHCRACGKVICSDCCGEAPLEYVNFSSRIVCPRCYNSLLHAADIFIGGGSINGSTKLMRLSNSAQSSPVNFKKPKNVQQTDDQIDCAENATDIDLNQNDILLNGYLYCSENKSNSIRYWSVLRANCVLELYSAPGDPMCKRSLVLISYDLIVNDGANIGSAYSVDTTTAEAHDCTRFPESFKLVHDNQILISNRKSKDDCRIQFTFKADNAKLTTRWIRAILKSKGTFRLSK